MNAHIEVIDLLLTRATELATSPQGADAALKYTQAALNVAHADATTEATRRENARKAG